MANTLAPRGLINPCLKMGGEPRTTTRTVGATYASDFLPGQLVRGRADGNVIHLAATNFTSVLGVVASYLKAPSTQSPPTGSSKDLELQIVTDLINTEWELQVSSAAVADASVNIGAMCNIFGAGYLDQAHTAGFAADSVTRPYAPYMVGGTPATTAKMFRILGLVVDGKNDKTAANPRYRVEFNPGFLAPYSGSAPGV